MSFNLKKHASYPKMLEKHHDNLGQDDKIGTTNKLLEKNRLEEDVSLLEAKLSDKHVNQQGTTELQLGKHKPTDGLPQRTNVNSMDMNPLNLLEEKNRKDYVDSYLSAQEIEETEFWDEFLTQDIGDPSSQLQNHPCRFKSLTNSDVANGVASKQMTMASLNDADAMIYYIYRTSGENLTEEESKIIERLSIEKANLLKKLSE